MAIEQEEPVDFAAGANQRPSGGLTPDQRALVQQHQIGVGCDRAATKHALGVPDRVTLRTDARGATLLWHYEAAQYVDPRVFATSLNWRALPFPTVKMRYGVTLAFDQRGRVSTINEDIGVLAE
jgi:hypothetical protein